MAARVLTATVHSNAARKGGGVRREEIHCSPTRTTTARHMLKPTAAGDSNATHGRTSPRPILSTHNGLNGHAVRGRVSPSPTPITNNSLTIEQIEVAIARSRDDGKTLDFSNRDFTDIGEEEARQLALVRSGDDEEEESCIHRIALVGNLLTTLPKGFALLSRLRYLTLRSNSFTVFPEVLTAMPALEILDFSRNKLTRLPSNPGTLANLRVMSISRNKLRKLPSYLAKFRALTVLKADHNPIEWPPKHVVESKEDLEDHDVMARWVESLKTWLTNHHAEEYSPSETSPPEELPSPHNDDQDSNNAGAGAAPHLRSFSVDSRGSVYTSSSFGNSIHPGDDDVDEDTRTPERPPPLKIGRISPSLPAVLSSSPDSYLPTPDDSMTSAEDDIAGPLPYSLQLAQDRDRQHGRNRSYAYEGQNGSKKGGLNAQKSLPDLRTARVQFTRKEKARDDVPDLPVSRISKTSPVRHYATPPSSMDKPEPPPALPLSSVPVEASADVSSIHSRPIPRPSKPPPTSTGGRAPSMDYERNSYFRRLSTLPTSSIARTVPAALLTVVDRARGILFAVSQIYQSLQHYTVYAIDERLSAVLLKVLDPASNYMLQLITALDQFDSMSRRGFPPPTVCRRVVESCRDNVAVFGKAIGVLALQLKVLASHDDVRYSRQMLLVLYGAMAEVSHAWQGMAPQLEAIEPLLREVYFPPVPRPLALSSSATTSNGSLPIKTHPSMQSSSSRILIPPIAEQPEPSSTVSAPGGSSSLLPRPSAPTLARTHSAQPIPTPSPGSTIITMRPSTSEGQSRMNRRHAGSFSVKDVEIGRSLPSNFDDSHNTSRVASGSSTPTPRSHPLLPKMTPPLPTSSHHVQPSPILTQPPLPLPHSRQPSATAPTPGAAPGLSIAPATPLAASARTPGTLDVPSNSTTLVDKEAIDAMAAAVRAAPAVWAMLDEFSGVMPDAPFDLRESLAKAQDVTGRLGENIKHIQEGLPTADRKALREDAHVFVKTVISLSKVVKDYGSAHSLSMQLRKDIAKLTNATQEFVILLHVSSFSPSSTPRPYSPMPNGFGNGGGNGSTLTPVTHASSSNLNNLGAAESSSPSTLLPLGAGSAGLSRSRSAQPPASSKLATPALNGSGPRSALPNQSFKIPMLSASNNVSLSSSRTNSRLRNGVDLADADGHG